MSAILNQVYWAKFSYLMKLVHCKCSSITCYFKVPVLVPKVYFFSPFWTSHCRWQACRNTELPHQILLKESLICSTFFKLLEILVSKESSYFLITHVQCYRWKAFHLDDTDENVIGYGNYIKLTESYKAKQIKFYVSKLTRNWKGDSKCGFFLKFFFFFFFSWADVPNLSRSQP